MSRAPRTLQLVVALLLAIAAVPIGYATLSRTRWESCGDPGALGDPAAIAGSAPEAQSPPGRLMDGTFLYRRGELSQRTVAGGELAYVVVRSDNATLVFADPTRPLTRTLDPDRVEMRQLEVDGVSVPVHVQSQELARHVHLQASIFVYDGAAVTALLPLQLRTALAQLVRGTRPITQYTVHGIARRGEPGDVLDPARAWLEAAWRRHRSVCES